MTAPPLIAHVIHRLDIGGLENGVVNLVNRIPEDRYRHAIVCLAGFDANFRARIRRADIAVVDIGKRPGKDPRAYARMWQVLRGLRPAIVHTRNLSTIDMQWMALLAGVPHRVHGEHGWDASDPGGRNRKNLAIRRACRPAIHRFVPMSRDIAGWLQQSVRVDPMRIRQIYNGVDVERFAPRRPERRSAAVAEEIVVGTVGRLDPVKNHATLIEAVARLLSQFPALRLLIVGDGPLRGTLRERAAALGIAPRVTFTGARDDVADLLQSMQIFVLPSISEGISNTILEAMASALPVVAAKVGGNPELVVDGVTGTLYEAGSIGALERALQRYIADPALRAAHGQAGRQRVVQDFSLDAMVRRYVALYDELTVR
ncbi:MAG: TIGR03088 family PEP-CTERM/XrtA system glycosyltransferase [Steroidobacteraceae bacterium]|nr:TIGR03088 family PEP-CTERM/XrtA system glycosyltransferase [Steroidobacteraceae bacterium]MDW8258068.1 TIGR03088 family PEP-CTERM/XrtA system glycosyltransferase [Gammaproteobacteria bacterium]